MAARGPKIPGARFSEKKTSFFLKFIEPVTPLWVLYPSEIIPVCAREPPLARAVLARSIKMLGWQPGAPKSREHDFPKKKTHDFLKFIGSATPPWVLYPSETMHMGYTGLLLARAVSAKSIKVLGWQPGSPKTREHDLLEKKRPSFFEIHRTSDTSMGSVSL